MKSTIHGGRWAGRLVVLASALLALGASAAQQDSEDAVATETRAVHPNGAARFIVTEALRGRLGSTAGDWEGRAFEVVEGHRSHFGLANPRAQLVLRMTRADAAGGRHVRLSQEHRGIGVEGAELVVHFDRHGEPTSITGIVVPNLDLDTTPAISAEEAAGVAIAAARATAPERRLGIGEARLVVFNDGLLDGRAGSNTLAYKITVTGPAVREFVYVDARTGGVLDQITGIYHTRDRSTFDMNNSQNYATATLVRVEGQGPVGDVDADNAHDYAGNTYDLYFNAYGRDSIDNAGFPLRSYVHYGVNYENAFWDGQRMTYGDGFPVDDVAGHEITHGVTERTSGLIYRKQSGALNESLSDIFGEMIDLLNGSGDDSPAVKWLLGEDIPGIGAIRNLSNPPAFGDPDRVGSPLYFCGRGDSGGVHTNSGVPNKNFALLVDGGTFNGKTVVGMGLTKAAAIHYQAQTNYLVPSSQFRDFFTALRQSCTDLLGIVLNDPVTGLPSGQAISAANCQNVLRAGQAVQFTTTACP